MKKQHLYRSVILTTEPMKDPVWCHNLERKIHNYIFLEYVHVFTHKTAKVPKVNSSATTKYSCCGNVSILIPCPPLPPVQMVHTRNVAEHHGIPAT